MCRRLAQKHISHKAHDSTHSETLKKLTHSLYTPIPENFAPHSAVPLAGSSTATLPRQVFPVLVIVYVRSTLSPAFVTSSAPLSTTATTTEKRDIRSGAPTIAGLLKAIEAVMERAPHHQHFGNCFHHRPLHIETCRCYSVRLGFSKASKSCK